MLSRYLEEMRQDVRQAARMLIQHPSFTAAAVLSLAIGIGANSAIFSVVDAVLLNPLPYAAPDRLIAIHGTSSTTTRNSVSYPNFLDMRARARTFEDIAAWRIEMFTLAGQPQAERLIGGRVSASYFSILRVPPLLGRTFEAREDQPGAPRVVLLGERLWRRRFAADPHVIGQHVTLEGEPYTVIGVMPARVGVGVIPRLYNDVFLPIGQYGDELFLSRHVNAAAVIGRLRPGVDVAEARAEMDTVATSLAAAYPESNNGVGINVVPLGEDLVGNLQPTLVLLLATVTFVLLIACANVSNLILARFTRRTQEFAVRLALGANRARIVRQALTESACLAFAGGVVGVVLAAWGTRAALRLVPSALPDIVNVQLNARVLIVATAVSLVSGFACAIVPAVRATRPTLGHGLQHSGRAGSSRRHRAQHTFLIIQVALTLILLVGAGLLARSLARVWRVDPGFEPRGIVTFMTGLSGERASDAEHVRTTVRRIAERLAAVPGVEAASAVFGAVPYTGNNNAVDFWRAGEPKPVGSDAPLALFSAVGPDYFQAMRIPLRKGRAFASHDTSQSPRVAIVDEAFAASVYPGRDPIGQRIHLDPITEPVEIIGVVGQIKHWGLDDGVAGNGARVHVYVPYAQLPDSFAPLAARGFSLVVRSSSATAEALGSLRAALREYDSGQVMINETAMTDGIARSLAGRRFSLIVLGIFALLALVLAIVGVYGLASYLATERTQEIGVRIALGAQRRDIVQALLGPIAQVAATGLAFGLLASLALARFVAGMLFNTSPVDPMTLTGVAMLLAAATLTASYLPARRALRADPMLALRHE
jgi:predicted permease